MASNQKTARFTAVVAEAGRPRVHLTFLAAEKDSELKSAIKAHRVMSLIRLNTGTKKDYGLVGYVEELASQVLIFPKSVKAFEDRRIVGINYDMLAEEKEPPARAPRKGATKSGRKAVPRVPAPTWEPVLETPAPPAAAQQKPLRPTASPRAAGTAPKIKPQDRKKAPKPPRLTLRKKLETVLLEWETGSEGEAKDMLRKLTHSLKPKRH